MCPYLTSSPFILPVKNLPKGKSREEEKTPPAKGTRTQVNPVLTRQSTLNWEQKVNTQLAGASAECIQLYLTGQEGDQCSACPPWQTGVLGLMHSQKRTTSQLRADFQDNYSQPRPPIRPRRKKEGQREKWEQGSRNRWLPGPNRLFNKDQEKWRAEAIIWIN